MRDPIDGDGLVLRPPRTGDRARWLELFQDPDELRFGLPAFVPIPHTLDDLDDRLASAVRAFDAREPGTLVVAGPDDSFLGTVGWRLETPPLHVADIGYGVHPDARGRRVATRAMLALVRWLTVDADGPGLPRVQLDHSVDNVASCRTALAAGLEQEGIRRCFLPMRDPDHPGHLDEPADPAAVRRHDVCLHGLVAP